MKKISLDGIKVLGGLEWTTLPSDKPHKKALAEYLSHNKGLRHGIVMQYRGEGVVGRIPPGPKEKTAKIPSAAALLALANQRQAQVASEANDSNNQSTVTDFNWIVVQQIDNDGQQDLYWMGAVSGGLPTPGADLVGTLDEITNRIEQLMHVDTFTIFTRDKQIRYYFALHGSIIDKQFAELVAGIPQHKAEVKMFSFAGLLTGGILLGFVLLVGGWWAFTTWQEKVQQEKARLEAQRAQAEQDRRTTEEINKYEQDVRALVLRSLDEGMAEIDAGLASTAPLDTLIAWRDLIYNLDVYQSTWKLTGVNCALENQTPLCVVNLQRGEMGNNRQLLLEHSDAVIDGDMASYTVRGADLSPRDVNSSQVIAAMDFQKGLLSDLQVLRQASVTHQVAASQDIVKDVELPPAPAGLAVQATQAVEGAPPAQQVSLNLGFASGQLEISGEGVWQISGLGKYLNQPNVRVTEFSTTIQADSLEQMTWNVKAAYFIRNLPQPVIPEIPLGERKLVIEVPAKFHSSMEVSGGISESSVQGIKNTAMETASSDNAPLNTNPVPLPNN